MGLEGQLKLLRESVDKLAKNIYTNRTVTIEDLEGVQKIHDRLIAIIEKDKDSAFAELKTLLKKEMASDAEELLLDTLIDMELIKLRDQEEQKLQEGKGDLVKKMTLDAMIIGGMPLLYTESPEKLVADIKLEQEYLGVLIDLVNGAQGEKVASSFMEMNDFAVAKAERMVPPSRTVSAPAKPEKGPEAISMAQESSSSVSGVPAEAPSERVEFPFISTIVSMLGLSRN